MDSLNRAFTITDDYRRAYTRCERLRDIRASFEAVGRTARRFRAMWHGSRRLRRSRFGRRTLVFHVHPGKSGFGARRIRTGDLQPERLVCAAGAWSIYGAERVQIVATSGESTSRRNARNKPNHLHWIASCCRLEHMVRRGPRFESVRGLFNIPANRTPQYPC